MQLVDCMIRTSISIACLQETEWVARVGERAKEIETTRNKLFYIVKDRHKKWVRVVAQKHLKDSIVTVMRKGDRIIFVKLLVGEKINS